LSFSSSIKNELCRIESQENCCYAAELAAVVKISGEVRAYGNDNFKIRIVTENAAFARRLY